MTIQELEEYCARAREQNSSGLYLVVTRDEAPRGNIRITGFGLGILLNAKEKDGRWECTCMFKRETVEKNIAKFKKNPLAFK